MALSTYSHFTQFPLGSYGYDDDERLQGSDDVTDGSEDDTASEEGPTAAAPDHGCAPVEAGTITVRVLALAGGPRGHFSQALARRAINLMDLLHRDLVAAPAPTGQNARRRYEAQITVSTLMLARSARSVRALVRALAAPAPAAHRKTQQPQGGTPADAPSGAD